MRSHDLRLLAGLWLLASLPALATQQPPATPPSPAGAAAPQAPAQPAVSQPAPAAPFSVSGTVRNGKTFLPGVTVTAANTLTGKKFATTTGTDGAFTLSIPARGRYVIRTEFLGFGPQTQEVLLNPQSPAAKVDFEILLASRVEEQQQEQQAARATNSALAAGRGFQNLGLSGDFSSGAGLTSAGGVGSGDGNGGGAPSAETSGLPFGGSGADAATESVVSGGGMGQSQGFGNVSEEQLQERIREFRERAQQGGFGGPGGGGFGGGPGGGGPIVIGGGRRGFNINQPHGALYFADDNAIFDAAPFSITGAPSMKADYNQARFGAFVGGPLKIPKIYDGGLKTFFFLGYNGSRASNPYDAYSTVPTPLERAGNFSQSTLADGTPVQIFAPAQVPAGCPVAPGQQFSDVVGGVVTPNVIPASCISSAAATAAATLLPFIPAPNVSVPGSRLNFHYVTSGQSDLDAINLRLIHNFGSGGGPGGLGGPFGGGGPGGRGGRSGQNVNFGVNYRRTDSQILNPFPSLAGSSGTQGLNANAGYSYSHGKLFNLLRFNYNHLHTSASNLYAFVNDIEGAAGITGVSTDPFDFGLPALNFNDLRSIADPSAQRRLDQTYTISDTVGWSRRKHTLRFGGDFRRILQSIRSSQNARGTFTFTGFATASLSGGQPAAGTGYDFADFLLDLPQSTAIQCGSNFVPGTPPPASLQCASTPSYNFRANSWDLFLQDDWHARANFTINAGIRYEYQGPFTEASGRAVNLDISPGLACVAPVMPDGTGSCTGTAYPTSLVKPDRNNFAPRLGIAWKPDKHTVVRTGYSINYNLAQYTTISQQLAFQPPFSLTETNTISACPSLTLTNGFLSCPAAAVSNNYAVDPGYRLGYVQLWNLDLQRELPAGVMLNVGYNGAKGTRLDIVEAPNRTPTGVLVPGVQPFLLETSLGNSILHAGSIRVRKRLQGGIAVSASYTFSKSIDDASSIGGGAVVVAQNAADLAAERGLSSFDQRHRFTGNWIYELPFGAGKKYVQSGPWSLILSGWLWSGDFTIASGTPFSPRILGSFTEVNSGTTGTLRPDLTGQPTTVISPGIQEWFNPAAFVAPPAGQFGDAGRNIIIGPGQIVFDMSVSKTFQFKETRSLEFRATANNVFNHVNLASIDTVLNSPTFGQVTSAGTMRRVTLVTRFRF